MNHVKHFILLNILYICDLCRFASELLGKYFNLKRTKKGNN
jgi:hypothetical protein